MSARSSARRRGSESGPGSTGSKLLRQGLVRSALVANAYRPTMNPVALVPSFFASWLTTEAAPVVLASWAARTGLELRRRRRSQEVLGARDVVGLAISAGAAVGAANLIVQGRRSGEEFEAALSGLIPAEDLAQRPAALRAGALLPVLNGNSRRRRSRNIRYDSAGQGEPSRRPLNLDVYMPLDTPAPGELRPAVLQIHGGAWVLGSKNEQGIPLLNHLASCGWVGFNIDYQLSPRAKFPTHLVDCKRALVWIREHAEEYGVDPNFVVVTGGSAGGHLCALMALTQNDPDFQPGFEEADTSLQGAVPFYGVYDLTNRDGAYDSMFEQLIADVVMGVGLEAEPEKWAAYSPIDRITEEAPPMFVIHGDKDVLVPVEIARSFVARLRQISRRAVVYAELRGAQHAFEIFPSFRAVHTVEYVERFLNHIHSEYVARSVDEAVVETSPDDSAFATRAEEAQAGVPT